MMDPTALGALTLALEKAINGALRYDPGTRAAFHRLAGKSLALESTFPATTVYLVPQPEGSDVALSIHAYADAEPDTRLRGALPALLSLTFGTQHSLADSGVEVFGSTGVLAEFQNILQQVDIDWEEPVTAVLGNTLGHPFAQLLRNQFSWVSDRAGTGQRFAGDYLAEELRAVVGKEELESFYADVDQLRSAADRLAARIELLQQRFASRRGTDVG